MRSFKPLNRRIYAFYARLIILVFLGIFIGFNIFSQQFIQDGVQSQLNALKRSLIARPWPQDNQFDIPKQDHYRFGLEANVFIISQDYQVRISNHNNQELAGALAQYLQNANIDLSRVDHTNITLNSKQFSLSIIEDQQHNDSYFVFYVDRSGINEFVVTINYTLAIILIVAIGIVFLATSFFSKSITNPVKQLTAFANRIGQTDFRQETFNFKDLEFQQLGQKMNDTAIKLELYDKDQKTFFQNVSHELRTPLQTIKNYAEGIKYQLMDPATSSQTILEETDKLSDMVEDLLYLSRLDALGFHSMPMQWHDLREILELSATSLSALALKKQLKFTYQFDDRPVLFKCNEKHLERAFSNLLTNAIRYATSEIVLTCHYQADRIEVSIWDDGEGIDAADQAHLFDRFYKGKQGKHGIGLSIVQSVIKFYQADLLVTNEQGAKFTCIFKNTNQTPDL